MFAALVSVRPLALHVLSYYRVRAPLRHSTGLPCLLFEGMVMSPTPVVMARSVNLKGGPARGGGRSTHTHRPTHLLT